LPGTFVWTRQELDRVSAYRVVGGGRTLDVTFRVGADRLSWPVAAASLISKYLRELLMARFNAYFAHHGSEARPTAGYYNDAQRFLDETRALRRRLGIDDDALVRQR